MCCAVKPGGRGLGRGWIAGGGNVAWVGTSQEERTARIRQALERDYAATVEAQAKHAHTGGGSKRGGLAAAFAARDSMRSTAPEVRQQRAAVRRAAALFAASKRLQQQQQQRGPGTTAVSGFSTATFAASNGECRTSGAAPSVTTAEQRVRQRSVAAVLADVATPMCERVRAGGAGSDGAGLAGLGLRASERSLLATSTPEQRRVLLAFIARRQQEVAAIVKVRTQQAAELNMLKARQARQGTSPPPPPPPPPQGAYRHGDTRASGGTHAAAAGVTETRQAEERQRLMQQARHRAAQAASLHAAKQRLSYRVLDQYTSALLSVAVPSSSAT